MKTLAQSSKNHGLAQIKKHQKHFNDYKLFWEYYRSKNFKQLETLFLTFKEHIDIKCISAMMKAYNKKHMHKNVLSLFKSHNLIHSKNIIVYTIALNSCQKLKNNQEIKLIEQILSKNDINTNDIKINIKKNKD